MTTTGIQKHTDINWCKSIARLSLVMLGNKLPNAATVTNPLHSAEKRLTMLGSEGNHSLPSCTGSTCLTCGSTLHGHTVEWLLSPVILAARCCHCWVRTLDSLMNLLLNCHGFQPKMPKAQVTLEERAEACSGAGLDLRRDLMDLPSRIVTPLNRERQSVGTKSRFSHAGFIHIHTTVRALRYYNWSSPCSYRRHCIEQFHYLISVFNHAYLIFS